MYMYMYVCMNICMWVPEETKEDIRSPRAGVIASSELHNMVLETKLWSSAKAEHALDNRVISPAPLSPICADHIFLEMGSSTRV